MTEIHPSLIATTSELFEDEACAELKAAARSLGGPSPCDARVAAPGLIFVTLARPDLILPFERALAASRPTFVRHMHRIDSVLEVSGLSPDALQQSMLRSAQELISRAGADGQRVTPQVRKVASEAAVTGGQMAEWLRSLAGDHGAGGDGGDLILSCTALGHAIYMGMGTAASNLSSRMGGAVHYDMSRFPVSRAGAKLAEAFDVFPLSLIPRPARAIDLGAAPGGWTAVLVEQGFAVDAIDPGEMHPSLASHPQVTAHRVKAQDWRPKTGGYQLLTCDVNWSAKETAMAVTHLASHLAAGAFAIVTIKLNKGPASPQIEAVKSILSSCFQVLSVRLLFHNRREVTLLLKHAAERA